MTNHHPLSDAPAHATGFETRDVNIRGVLGLAAAVAVMVGVVTCLLWWLWTGFEARASRGDPKLLFPSDSTLRSRSPRLQETPARDYARYRKEQDQAASTYGWLDRESRTVHIPLDRAMELYLQRGAPPSWPAEKNNEEAPR